MANDETGEAPEARRSDISAPSPEMVAAYVEANKVVFHYVKSKHARTIHVDGVFGGPSPKGDGITIGVFSERHPYPDSSVYVPGPEAGKLVEDRARRKTTRDGVVREIEATLVLSLENAIQMKEWLDEHIDKLQRMRQTEAIKSIFAERIIRGTRNVG